MFTRKVNAGTRVYYVDVYRDSKAQPYIRISEIATDRHPDKSRRGKVFIHVLNMRPFIDAVDEAAAFIEGSGHEG